MTHQDSYSETDLMTQDGHLTELTVDRHLVDEFAQDERALVDAHLGACQSCREWLAEIRAFDEQTASTLRPQSSSQHHPLIHRSQPTRLFATSSTSLFSTLTI